MIIFTLTYLFFNIKRYTTNPLYKKIDKNLNSSRQVFKEKFFKPTSVYAVL